MRSVLALIFFCLAAWRGYKDYSATQGTDQPFVMVPSGTLWEQISPGTYNSMLPKMQELDFPYFWDPVMQSILNWPATLLFLALAFFFFVIRRRAEPDIEVY